MTAVSWSGALGERAVGAQRDLVLTFSVLDGETPAGVVDVVATGVRDHQIGDANGGGVGLVDDAQHPGLIAHTEPRETLHFEAPPGIDTDAVMGALFLAHRRAFDDWIAFDRYLDFNRYASERPPPEELLRADGTLVTGPRSLVACYRAVLDERGYSTRATSAPPPSWWDGERWRTDLTPLAMLHFGNSWVVAQRFDARVRMGAAEETH